MLKSKFLDVMRTFSHNEFREFRNFVRSPFHNTNKKVIAIIEILNKYFPDLSNKKLGKENLFALLYPSKKYNDVVMRILISDLLKLSEEYLAITNFRKDQVTEKKFLLNELNERNLHSLFKRNLNSAEKDLSRETLIDVSYFSDLFELQSKKIDNIISKGNQPESANDVRIQGEYLITHFLINILNIAHELETQRDVLNVKFDFNIVSEFINYFNMTGFIKKTGDNNFRYQPIIEIYYYMYMSIIHTGVEENFLKLKDLIYSNFNIFKREEKFNLFIILESLCTFSISSGKRDYFTHLFDIYNLMISKELYTHSESEYFQINLFRNMFYTALVLNEISWAENFVKRYLDKVSPQSRDDIGHLAYAYIHFSKKEFEKALVEINEVRYNFFVYKYDVRILTLKIYYELNYFEQALSLLDTFSHFLAGNKKVSEELKQSFTGFLFFLRKLIKIRSGTKEDSPGMLIQKIKRTEKLNNKKWLLEKAVEI